MIVAIYQNRPEFGDIRKNIINLYDRVINESFDLLVLPELFATGYQFKNREEAVSFSDKAGQGFTFDRIKELATQKNALIVYGYPETAGMKLFNSALAITPDGNYYNYQKTHLFDSEKNYFDPGQTGFVTFDYNNTKFGLMVCFDWRFPESARRLALDGAQIICHPSNLVMPHCPDAMVTRALENNVFTITANRVGTEDRTGIELRFIGKSRIISPKGEILASLSEEQTEFVSIEIDPSLADIKNINSNNHIIEDRCPDYY